MTKIRVLHLTFHIGCARDLAYIGERLNMQVDFVPKLGPLDLSAGARAITREESLEIWNQCKDLFNSYHVIVTSDITALSRIFLDNISEVKPHVIVWICNRFSICMDNDKQYFDLLRNAPKDKVTLLPYCDFERVWCGKFGIFVTEKTVQPLGCSPSPAAEELLTNHFTHLIDRLNTNASKGLTLEDVPDDEAKDTFVVLNYGNNTNFINMVSLLQSAGIKAVCRRHKYIKTLQRFKGIVHLPDQFSKFTSFEALHHGIITFIPSPKFMFELTRSINRANNAHYFFSVHGYGGELAPEHVTLIDWYNYEGGRIYFNSFDDLISKCKMLDSEQTCNLLKVEAQRDAQRHHYLTISQWNKVICRGAKTAGWVSECVPRWYKEPAPEVISTVKYLKCITAQEN